MKGKYILYILFFGILLVFLIYKVSVREKYKTLRNVGISPIKCEPVKKYQPREYDNKYSGNLYRHRRRYNFLGQRNSGQRQ